MICSSATLFVQGALMTKRTRKFLLSVFEFCFKEMQKAKREGILVLEDDCYGDRLTKKGEKIFNKKVDLFIDRLLRFIVDASYSTEGNLELLKSISRRSGKNTRTALKIASTCMDCLANGKNLNTVLMPVNAYVGEKNYMDFLELYLKLQRESEWKDNKWKDNKLVLTEEEKKRIEEVNVYFKMKEAECVRLLKKRYEVVHKLHYNVLEFKEYYATVTLSYKDNEDYFADMYWISSQKSDENNKSRTEYFEEIPVCRSLSYFWRSYSGCGRDIKKFMYLTDDIPNRIENNFKITSVLCISDEED